MMPIDKNVDMATWFQNAIGLFELSKTKSAIVRKRQVIIGENLKTGLLVLGLICSSKF